MFANFTFAQTSEKEIVNTLITTYNEKNFSAFYQLLSPGFKTQMSEIDLKGFLSENVYKFYGNIKSVDFKRQKQNQKFYKTIFEKGEVELMLIFNDTFKIDGLSLVPPKAEIVLRKEIISDNKMESALDKIIDSIAKTHILNTKNVGFSIGIIKDGKTFFYHYGEIVRESKKLPNINTIYEIGSITKTFTGFLLAQAVNDKKINLDDDIRKYLPQKYPNLEFIKKPILIKHLVSHTSSIARIPNDLDKQPNYDPLNPYANYSKTMVYNYLKTINLTAEPGTKQDYSNTGMALLGIILENIYGKSYEQLLQMFMLKPFQMQTTFQNVPENMELNFAQGYNQEGQLTPHWDLGVQVGAGGIKSSVLDMTTFLNENIKASNGTIKKSHEITFQNEKNTAGYAWVIQKMKNGDTLFWHNGGTYGFTSFYGFIRENNCGIVVLNNSGNRVDNVAISILKNL